MKKATANVTDIEDLMERLNTVPPADDDLDDEMEPISAPLRVSENITGLDFRITNLTHYTMYEIKVGFKPFVQSGKWGFTLGFLRFRFNRFLDWSFLGWAMWNAGEFL